MRLRNLLFVLLLCMTVGVLGASCTGDDGATGPPGPQGPPGPAAEPMDGDMEEPAFYDFLKSWGSETGEIACSDPLIQDMKAFPGPEMLDPIVDSSKQPAPEQGISVDCGDDVFDAVTAQALSAMFPGATITAADLVFVETERTLDQDPEVTETDKTATKRATRTTVTNKFIGGKFLADLNGRGGNDEYFERLLLHSECQNGTSPSDIRGDWRAIHKTEAVQEYDAPGDATADADIEAGVTKTTVTVKVCVRLDSILGAVKCFIGINNDGTDGDENQQIAIYDADAEEGKMLTTVLQGNNGATPAVPVFGNVATAIDNTANATAAADVFGTGLDISENQLDGICRLFSGGAGTIATGN